MQRFREPTETTTPTAPVYDSETVREVLSRAAQIEQERQEGDTMTAEQIETLGRELGLSPDAVRRSLGEKVGTVAPVQATVATQTEPLTRAQLIRGFAPLVVHLAVSYFLLSFWAGLPQSRLESTAQNDLLIRASFLLPFLLLAWAGWATKRVRLSIVGAIYLPLFSYLMLRVISEASGSKIPPEVMTSVLTTYLTTYTMQGAGTFALAAFARKWWDNLPRNIARRAAANR